MPAWTRAEGKVSCLRKSTKEESPPMVRFESRKACSCPAPVQYWSDSLLVQISDAAESGAGFHQIGKSIGPNSRNQPVLFFFFSAPSLSFPFLPFQQMQMQILRGRNQPRNQQRREVGTQQTTNQRTFRVNQRFSASFVLVVRLVLVLVGKLTLEESRFDSSSVCSVCLRLLCLLI